MLIRALKPLWGIGGCLCVAAGSDSRLCWAPQLTEALSVWQAMDRAPLGPAPFELRGRDHGWRQVAVATGPRIGISRAAELPWRFCAAGSEYLSRPLR